MLQIIILVTAFVGVATLVGGVAILFRGDPTNGVEDRLQLLTTNTSSSDRNKEISLLTQAMGEKQHWVEAFVQRFGNFNRFLEQADAPLTTTKFFTLSAMLAGAGAVLTVVAGVQLWLAPLLGLGLGMVPTAWLVLRRKRRLGKFAQQLPEALELVARALRAGHSLAAGFQLVGDEMEAPIGKEFSRVYDEQNLGLPLDEALQLMTDRVPNLDLQFFATAVILQRQTGGDLAEILDKIGRLVRERFKIFGAIQALTGEGRLSGVVLLGLPPVLFVVMFRLNPGYVMMLFEDPMGKQMLAVAIVLQAVGALVIRKIINIKV